MYLQYLIDTILLNNRGSKGRRPIAQLTAEILISLSIQSQVVWLIYLLQCTGAVAIMHNAMQEADEEILLYEKSHVYNNCRLQFVLLSISTVSACLHTYMVTSS